MIDDADVKRLVGAEDCAAVCGHEEDACEGECDDRGCMHVCANSRNDCEDGCKLGMNHDARMRMRAWLTADLMGRDNSAARMRTATIGAADAPGEWTAIIQNQFGFVCRLTWASDGSPKTLDKCTSKDKGWRAEPASIPLKCRIDKKRKVDRCEGSYRLIKDAFEDEGGFVLERKAS